MSRIFVCGVGAVSPAGWGTHALQAAVEKGEPLPVQAIERAGWKEPIQARLVPTPLTRPEFLSHPRLRRASAITQYAAAAALEATAAFRASSGRRARLGLVVCLQAGCVQYSCRFFGEVLREPATASPLLFPETVYAAPASHVATVLENVTEVITLLGDSATFLQGAAVGARWLEEERIEACLVIGAEEPHWLLADALWHVERKAILTTGAGALCLCRNTVVPRLAELETITGVQTFSRQASRLNAVRAMRMELGSGGCGELLCDSLSQSRRADAPEATAWRDWKGPRLSLKRVFGEGLMAGAAWQCVAACVAVSSSRVLAASVSLVGSNQHAIGARFVRPSEGSPSLPAGEPGSRISL